MVANPSTPAEWRFEETSVPMGDPDEWVHTASSTLRHLARCPHLTDTVSITVIPADKLDDYRACTWCSDESAGIGRRYFASIDEALEALQVPLENRPRMREVGAAHPHDTIWTNGSRSYIAVALGDGRMLAQFAKTWIWTRGGGIELLPNHTRARGRNTRAPEPRPTRVCPTCSFQLPATGICDTCG